MNPFAYNNWGELLSAIYLSLLKDDFAPFSYGETWALGSVHPSAPADSARSKFASETRRSHNWLKSSLQRPRSNGRRRLSFLPQVRIDRTQLGAKLLRRTLFLAHFAGDDEPHNTYGSTTQPTTQAFALNMICAPWKGETCGVAFVSRCFIGRS
jgi:hypothetical protein